MKRLNKETLFELILPCSWMNKYKTVGSFQYGNKSFQCAIVHYKSNVMFSNRQLMVKFMTLAIR